MKKTFQMLCILLFGGAFLQTHAQNKQGPPPPPAPLSAQAPFKAPAPLTAQETKQVIDTINKLLVTNYIYPQMADKMVSALSANFKKGNYRFHIWIL